MINAMPKSKAHADINAEYKGLSPQKWLKGMNRLCTTLARPGNEKFPWPICRKWIGNYQPIAL
jgi:hypothetical protein